MRFVVMTILTACLNVTQAWALLSDDFNPATSEPNPVWRYYDPYDITAGDDPGQSTLTFDGTNALISLPAGFNHDLWKAPNNKAPRLLQPQPNTDFQIEAKFDTVLNAATQLQGIIVQESNNVFLRFDIYHNGSTTPRLFAAYVNADTNSSTVYLSAALPETSNNQYRNYPKYRQVIRVGNSWTFRYSYDRITWTNAVTFSRSLIVSEVGVFAGTADSNPALLSSVDYFTDGSAPITDNDTWKAPPPVITAWYGYDQSFGQFGLPGVSQQWANILGNVFSHIDLSTMTYRTNGGPEQILSFGPDTHQGSRQDGRLVKTGDFNIEIDSTDSSLLNPGANIISITATDSNGTSSTQTVTLDYEPGNEWPLPYTANWQLVKNPSTNAVDTRYVENVAHIVDGLWKITAQGIRVAERGYDRAIAVGDMTWLPHYEVTVPFTLHSSLNGIGFAVGWQGHTGIQSPRIEWPLEALAWVRGPLNSATLEIMTYGGLAGWEVVRASQPLSISTNITYLLKGRTELLNSTTSRFYLKIWPQGGSEPIAWNLTADIPRRDGSVLLVAYDVDATFGNVLIEPISSSPSPDDTTPPVISNVQATAITADSATITWTTNEAANSGVNYGLTTGYGSTAGDAALVTTHSVTLTGLSANTVYHYQVTSADASSNAASSGDLTFTTSDSGGGGSTPSGLVSDSFTGTLNTSLWSFYDPKGDSVLSTTGAQASIAVPANSSHDLWRNALFGPRIRQAANNTDFEVEAKFDAALSSRYQQNGIIVEQDNDDFIRFDFYSDGSVTRIFAASFVNGSPTTRINSVIATGAPLYLRVKRTGNQWTESYSYNGANWISAVTFAHTLTVANVGLFAGNNGSPAPAFTALFDYFIVDGMVPGTGGGGGGDTTPPVISNVQATAITADSATITWTTNEAANSGVNYGLTTGYGSTAGDAALVTTHSVTLTGLSASTLYHYRVTSADASSNAASSGDLTFTTSAPSSIDTTPLVISNVQATTITADSATITWTTNEAANSSVNYGLTSAYGSTGSDSAMVTNHSLTLNGLSPNKLYHYQVTSSDASHNSSSSGNLNFSTDTIQTQSINNWSRISSSMGDLPVPPNSDGQSGFKVVDLDNDGQTDYLFTLWAASENLIWYRRVGNSYVKHVLDTGKKNLSHSDEFRDIDRDGDLDIIIGDASNANTMNWWENPYPNYDPTVTWTRRVVRNIGENFYHDSIWGDFDEDGTDEYISWNQYGRQLLLFEVPADPRTADTWPVTQIFSWSGDQLRFRGSDAVDINLDGTADFVGGCSWFEHTGGTTFVRHAIDEAHSYGSVEAGQLIAGGRPEVVCYKELEDGPLNMYTWTGSKWESRTLIPYVGRGHTLQIGDINADGHSDIMMSEMAKWSSVTKPTDYPDAKLIVLYGDGSGNFSPQTVSEGQGYLEGQLSDIDNDGDLDMITPPFRHNIPRLDMWINQGIAESGDNTPPTIKNVQVSVRDTTATITWTTNEVSIGSVHYGQNTDYGSSHADSAGVLLHSMVLTRLTPDTVYHYQVRSIDNSGNVGQSADLSFTTLVNGAHPSGLLSDHFTGALDTNKWTFYDPKGDSSVSTTGTQLSISVPAGGNHDLWKNAFLAPRMRQSANNTDFQIEIKLDSKLAAANQMHGLTIEQDNDDLIRFDFFSDGSVTRVFSASFVNGSPTTRINKVISSSAPTYLRVNRIGNQWTLSYSYNGVNWNTAVAFQHTLTVTSIGIFSGNAGSQPPAYTAQIDYFKVDD